MNGMNYIGLDIHKKSISCCVRQADGTIIQESTITATRQALDEWVRRLPQPWMAGMEATLFTGWVYDHLVSGGAVVKVAHPAMLRDIAAGKKKNDRVDARKIADLLRCDYFPECHMASREIRDRRRVLRYRNLLVRQAVQMKNRDGGQCANLVLLNFSRAFLNAAVQEASPNNGRVGPSPPSTAATAVLARRRR